MPLTAPFCSLSPRAGGEGRGEAESQRGQDTSDMDPLSPWLPYPSQRKETP